MAADRSLCSVGEIERRQQWAKRLSSTLRNTIRSTTDLSDSVELVIWHGSLPRGRGGRRYDVDLAVFLRAQSPCDLLSASAHFLQSAISRLPELSYRGDLHYDGMRMFEAHGHWDSIADATLPHIGVHTYRSSALCELFGPAEWRSGPLTSYGFYRMLNSWSRFCFFFRHWIDEGEPIYDPAEYVSRARTAGCDPPDWLVSELCLVAKACVTAYAPSSEPCTVGASRKRALSLVAMLAYALEKRPIGRSTRFKSDLRLFKRPLAKSLLSAAINDDLPAAKASLLDDSPPAAF